jgi:hypothetical protein
MNEEHRLELRDWAAGVMGWYKRIITIPDSVLTDEEYWETNKIDGEPDFVMFTKLWNPLTDLNQTFMVVERMRELGWKGFEVRQGCVAGNWEGLFSTNDPGRWLRGPSANNPALAILLAAKATGVK